MPRISSFYGITIYMYWNEAHHARPHFHARYAGKAREFQRRVGAERLEATLGVLGELFPPPGERALKAPRRS